MTRSRKKITPNRGSKTELIESLKFSVPRGNASDGTPEFIRIGPASRLWHEHLAQRVAADAKAGDIEAAREILADFVGAISQYTERTWKGPVYWPYALYIAEVLEKVLEGKPAEVALGLKSSKPGRRTKKYDYEALAAAFNLLLAQGFTPKQAKLDLREKIGADIRTIEIADGEHQSYGMWARQSLREDLSQDDRDHALEVVRLGAEPYAAEIESILTARKSR